jgi:hypothetical protein
MAAIVISAGTTVPLRFQLLDDGLPVDLSGMTVTLELSDRLGTALTTSGMVTVTSAGAGEVDFTPSTGAFFTVANGPCFARWKLVNSLGGVSFVPNGLRERWTIVAE